MARNQEKSQSMLNRYISSEKPEHSRRRRPYLASECRDLPEADKWRQQIMREIGRFVLEIQNEGLGEHRLRDVSDEINKLIREKSHWEKRIIELGGPNYMVYSAKMTDLDGNIVDVPNSGGGRGPGYRYFGAAKKLPGVRELFEKPPESRKRRRAIHEIYKRIDAGYYGYIDDDDGILEKLEEQTNLFENAIDHEEREEEFLVHVPLPDEKEIERMVVQRTKMELLKKYVSEELMEEEREAKAMLNIQRIVESMINVQLHTEWIKNFKTSDQLSSPHLLDHIPTASRNRECSIADNNEFTTMAPVAATAGTTMPGQVVSP